MNKFGVVVTVLAAACGGGGGGGNDVDAPGGVDMPPPDMPPPAQKLGVVGVFEQTVANQQLTGVLATFSDGTGSTTPDRTEGPCVVRSTAGATATAASAGTVTVTRGAKVVTLTPDGASKYQGQIDQGFVYAPGDALAFAAAGATVPAFSGDLTFPDAVTITDPTGFPAGIKSGFSIAWTGAAAVHVTITQSNNVVITCDLASSPGAIPAAALSDLIPGNQQAMQIGLVIGAFAVTTKTAGDFAVELQALNGGLSAIGFAQ